MIRHEFEFELISGDTIQIIADITPGEPARLTGHPDDMHDGAGADWSYEIFRDGVIVSWEWEAQNVTTADYNAIDGKIMDFLEGP